MSTSNLELIEVSPSTVVFFTHGNIGGISLKNFLIVIDGGKNPERAKVFREEFENLFNLPVKYFVLTHRHTDHRYGAVAFKDCKFIWSKKTAEIMPRNFKLSTYDAITFEKKYVIGDQELIVEIHHTGGHTAGSSFVYFPSERVVFTGDLVLEKFPWLTFVQDGTCNFDDWIAALEYINSFELDKIVPGHGPVLDSKNDLKKHLELYYAFRSVVKKAVEEKRPPNTIELPELEYVEEIKDLIPTLPPKSQRRYRYGLNRGQELTFKYLYKFYK